jgi:hypothetical protein
MSTGFQLGPRAVPRGPLPKPGARRQNPPTIPGAVLPAAGRDAPAPESPLALGEAGARWWAWAWSTPQAAKWDTGSLYFVARRALLEDHSAALTFADELDLGDLFAADDLDAKSRVEWALSLLKRSATGEVALMKEMRELDNRLGLNPKAMADLRWSIGEPEAAAPEKPAPVRRLRAIDPAA